MKILNLERDKNYGKHIVEIGILIMVANLLTAIFIWQSILHGWKVEEGNSLFYRAYIQNQVPFGPMPFNQEGGYLGFLRIVFTFLGNREGLVLLANLCLQLAGVGFFYRAARRVVGVFASLIIAIAAAIAAVMEYDVISDTPMHLVWTVTALGCWLITVLVTGCDRKEGGFSLFLSALLGGLVSIWIFWDLSGLCILISLLFLLLSLRKPSFKKKAGLIVSSLLGCGLTFVLIVSSIYTYENFNAFFIFPWLTDRTSIYLQNRQGFRQLIALCALFSVSWLLILIYTKARLAWVMISEAAGSGPADAEGDEAQEQSPALLIEPEKAKEVMPEVIQTEGSQPEPKKSKESMPEIAQTEESQPEAKESKEGMPEIVQTEESQPEPKKSKEGMPKVAQTEESQPEAKESKESMPKIVQTEENQPEAKESKEGMPEIAQTEGSQPEAKESKEGMPKIAQTEGSQSEAKERKESMPKIAQTEESQPEPGEKEEEKVCETHREEKVVKKVNLIENPLPLPKKRARKKMNYAFEPSKEQMHYDLNNYNVNDDYDLKG